MRRRLRFAEWPGREWPLHFSRYADHDFVARTIFGARISGNSRDLIQRHIYYFGAWETNLTRFVNTAIQNGDVFVDVGANIGYFTLQASKLVGKSGKVISFEASPRIFAKLRDNLSRNRVTNVTAHNLAVSDTDGLVKIYLASSSNIGETTIIATDSADFECEVAARPLSALLSPSELARVRVIKIDVEGAESQVVAGLLPMLRGARLDLEIAIEISPKRLRVLNKKADDIVASLSDHGFFPYRIENSYLELSYLSTEHPRPERIRGSITAQTDVIFSRRNVDSL